MQSRLPREVVWRKKAGFNVPNARWIKGELKPLVLEIALSEPTFAQWGS